MLTIRMRLPAVTGLFFGFICAALVTACVAPGPLPPPVAPTPDLAGTVTAQAAPMAATQTALVASLTQVAQAQAALVTQPAPGEAAGAAVATATALARAVAAQAVTATSLAAANATALTQAGATTPAAATALPPATPIPPTVAPIPTLPMPAEATGPCVAADKAVAAIGKAASDAGVDPGCPVAAASSVNGALQEFWNVKVNTSSDTFPRSLMIWREDTGAIYLLQGQNPNGSRGTLQAYTDQYQDGQPDIPPACVGIKPPPGYEKPIRGFGLVWCADHLYEGAGWPNRRETQASLMIQPTRNGLLMRVSAPEAGAGYLVALNYQSKRVITTIIAP